MKIYDREIEIIEFFQSIHSSEILLLPENDKEVESICLSVHEESNWSKWKDSSGKSDPPPDFYNEDLKLMMDVMRVDDHGHIGKNGKSIVNPTLQRETEVMRDLEKRGILDMFPGVPVHLLVDTGLPTDEDHNYIFYRDNFLRTVGAHIKKIKSYQLNHPGFKTIFFIFDESSFYFESANNNLPIRKNELFQCTPHMWFLDKAFTDILEDTQIDYLIWFSPYKHCKVFDPQGQALPIPRACALKVRGCRFGSLTYDATHMVSSEI